MTKRREARIHKIILPTHCRNDQNAEFHAVTDGFSAAGIRFRSAITPRPGESLTCTIRHVGLLRGEVVQSDKGTFLLRVVAEREVIGSIMRKLVLLSARQQSQSGADPDIDPS